MSKIKNYFRNLVRKTISGDSLSLLSSLSPGNIRRNSEYLEWFGAKVVGFVNEYIDKNQILDSFYLKRLNKIFKTDRFNLFIKKWLMDYFYLLFGMLNNLAEQNSQTGRTIELEDDSLNHFIVEKYLARFNAPIKICWKPKVSLVCKVLKIFKLLFSLLVVSLGTGIKFNSEVKKYKVMREAVWGLYDIGGKYYHDDFFVDGRIIKKEDLLLFTRGTPTEGGGQTKRVFRCPKINLFAFYSRHFAAGG
ncbi:hypothetical protein ACFL5U_00575 [Candidatus Margulisiibacteriota bacterium]